MLVTLGDMIFQTFSVAEPEQEAGGAVIKLPPGAGTAITNCGSGSGSLLLYQRMEKIL
jgi:hypothetical protein